MIEHEFLHKCPRCGNTKISEKARVYCDDCSGLDNSIMQMVMGNEVFTMSYTAGDYSHLNIQPEKR